MARPKTLSGLAGLGDLVLTCTGELSRNRTVGMELAHGRKLEEITGSMRMVAEGIKTTTATIELAGAIRRNADHRANVPDAALRAAAAGGHPPADGAIPERGE